MDTGISTFAPGRGVMKPSNTFAEIDLGRHSVGHKWERHFGRR